MRIFPRIGPRKLVATLVAMLLLGAGACTGDAGEVLRGILQNVDSVNGQITIVTDDGRTVTLTIATDGTIETDGTDAAIEALAPGAVVEYELNDGELVQHLDVHQAQVEGVIVAVEGNQITVENERGRQITVEVTGATRIELEEHFPGTIADLVVGLEVEIKFDPESLVAYKVDVEEEEAEVEAIVVEVDGDALTIETERGRRLTVVVGLATRIELDDDIPGTIADLAVGTEMEVKFNPSTFQALRVEVEDEEHDDDHDDHEHDDDDNG